MIEQRGRLGEANRIMERQHGHGRPEPDAVRLRGDVGEESDRVRRDRVAREVVLGEPREVEPELLGHDDLLDRVEVLLMLLRAFRPLDGLERPNLMKPSACARDAPARRAGPARSPPHGVTGSEFPRS